MIPIVETRLSNIELLRIVAIFFILICHADGRILGVPTSADIEQLPLQSSVKLFFDCLAVGGVDIFILISGWFGVRPRFRGIAKLLYQVVFLLWGIYVCFLVLGKTSLDLYGLKVSLGLTGEYWFVMAYLGMYILSPVLNSFAEKASRRDFQILLLMFYAFQCYYCWLTATVDYYSGYSVTFFCGLYLTARYFRLYPVSYVRRHGLAVFCWAVVCIFIISTVSLYVFNNAARMLRYDNPMVIIASLGLQHAFAKLKLRNSLINRVAASCLAVYVIHFNPFVYKYFEALDKAIYSATSGVFTVFAIGIYLVVVLVLCVLIDQLRLITWNVLQKGVWKN